MKILITDSKERKPYDCNTINQRGMGGSSNAVIYLGQEFRKLGFDVVVANNNRECGTSKGIKFVTLQYLENNKDIYDIWINNRTPKLFRDLNVRAYKKIFWAHDMFYKDLPIYYPYFEYMVTVSGWHLRWLDNLYHVVKSYSFPQYHQAFLAMYHF